MELLTIGAFARATRLSTKALRLYDELGLLPPAAVDGESGYRFYAPDQLERARLIASLRRLGMSLARIRVVLGLEGVAAADEVASFWSEIVAETADRERLAADLVQELKAHGEARPRIRAAARSDRGLVRPSNEDVAYAGRRLVAVADGVGGPSGARASAAAVDALQTLDAREVPSGELLAALAAATVDAERAVRGTGDAGEAVTTLTAMLLSADRMALVHIGDTRAYALRGGELSRLTADHTWVQAMVDEGRMSTAEADAHPQRSLLVRALTSGGGARPDLSAHDVVPGDRYLLCSDGLTTTASNGAIAAALSGGGTPDEAVDRLIALAYAAGAPDNVACVVADVAAP
jgi:serine/threonine protein phosphatase PrpC